MGQTFTDPLLKALESDTPWIPALPLMTLGRRRSLSFFTCKMGVFVSVYKLEGRAKGGKRGKTLGTRWHSINGTFCVPGTERGWISKRNTPGSLVHSPVGGEIQIQ